MFESFISLSLQQLPSVINVFPDPLIYVLSLCGSVVFFSWITWVPGLITLAGTTIEPLHHLSTQSSAHRHNQDSLAQCSHTERKREGESLIADFILSHSSCSCSQISIPRKSILQFCKVLTQQGAGTSSFPLFF